MGDRRTYRDRRDYLIMAVQKRRKKVRQMAIDYKECILLCSNCHREVHSGLQLPREIVVEKSGEFKEAYPLREAKYGNPEPSPESMLFRKGAETRASARTPDKCLGEAPDTLAPRIRGG